MFVNQKNGRVCAFIQQYISKNCDDMLKIIPEEWNVKWNVFDIKEAYLEYKNKYLRTLKKEDESKFNEYRNENEEGKVEYTNEKLGKLPIHSLIKRIKLDELLWDYDDNSLYPSAKWDQIIVYHRIETGYDFTLDLNKKLVQNSIGLVLLKEVLFWRLSILIQKI